MNVFSYWSGPVTWMERLSVVSARATGHDLQFSRMMITPS